MVHTPKPIEPSGSVTKRMVTFTTKAYRCEIECLDPDQVIPLLRDLGATVTQVKSADVQYVLERSVFFKLKLTNTGPDDLVFNPDHVILGSGRGPVASLVDMATFWPATVPEGHADREALAKIFARATVSLASDETHVQYLAFRAFGGRFPKNIYLELNDLYAGVEPFSMKCAFKIKYRDL